MVWDLFSWTSLNDCFLKFSIRYPNTNYWTPWKFIFSLYLLAYNDLGYYLNILVCRINLELGLLPCLGWWPSWLVMDLVLGFARVLYLLLFTNFYSKFCFCFKLFSLISVLIILCYTFNKLIGFWICIFWFENNFI